jgi:hypothetical protein
MKTIAKAILDQLVADANASAFVPLLDFTLPDNTHLRFARYSANITYVGANLYTAWMFSGQVLPAGKAGTVPTISLVLEDAVQILRPYAIDTDWFQGTLLTICLVCVDQLAADYAWSTVTYDILQAVPRSQAVVLKLGGPNPVKMRFPADRYWAWQCPYARGFKDDPRCSYGGEQTTCNGTFTRCAELGNSARFGGFPGLDPDAARLVIPISLRAG